LLLFIIQNSKSAGTLGPDTGGSVDPYTGSSSHKPSNAPSISTPQKLLPNKVYQYITSLDNRMVDTIKANNIELKKVDETKNLALSDVEIERISKLFSILKDESHYHVNSFIVSDYILLQKLLNFPIAQSVPVLDFLRCLLRHPNFASHVSNPANNFNILYIILEKLKTGNLPPIKITGLRCLVNLFQPPCLDLIEKTSRTDIRKYC